MAEPNELIEKYNDINTKESEQALIRIQVKRFLRYLKNTCEDMTSFEEVLK